MQHLTIKDANLFLGAPKDWNPERHGTCHVLPVKAVQDGDLILLFSDWKPSPEELALLNEGGSVRLTVVGASHPPVSITAVAAGS